MGVTSLPPPPSPPLQGEPLMYRHFERIVAAVRSANVKLNLTTNGSFPPGASGHSPEAWIRMLLPLLSDVKISWNGATAGTQEAIMRGSRFDVQLRNLRLLVRGRDVHLPQPLDDGRLMRNAYCCSAPPSVML